MAAPSQERPKLRPIDAVVVDDPKKGRSLLLRDPEGIAPGAVLLPGHLAQVVLSFDGRRTADEIAAAVRGGHVTGAVVARLASELDAACLLDTARYRARRREIASAFATSPVRPASHAGSAYHAGAADLVRFIEDDCLSRAPARAGEETLVGLCSPHMDLWRAAVGYGHAYRELMRATPPRADTFVLLGTSHAAMRRPFAVCGKAFDTPLGALEPDLRLIDEIAVEARFDVKEDEILHRAEHSLELQAVFLRYALGDRPARIVPILCGLGEAQARRREPSGDEQAESFVQALRAAVARRDGRVVVIAGADLAHVGPRFGDPEPPDPGARERLRTRDLASLRYASDRDSSGFFTHVAEDLDERRVCGLAPIYTMLRVLPREARGEVLHYAQHVDPREGSVVSHASVGFYL